MPTEPVTGTAAGVPYTALPPRADGPAPLLIAWHMMDAPCTDAAFAAALPLHDVPAWRVYLGMPRTGRRPHPTGPEEAAADPVRGYLRPVLGQAVAEFPDALTALRAQLPVDDGPIAVVGGSLGGAVALHVLADATIPVAAAAIINAAIRARTVVALYDDITGRPYTWADDTTADADRLDFVARATDIAARTPQPPLLVVSGDEDYPTFRPDAAALVTALREAYDSPDTVALAPVPGLAHPLAERPGTHPAPQTPTATHVDHTVTAWLHRHWTR
jgi:dienelactone hydrolase